MQSRDKRRAVLDSPSPICYSYKVHNRIERWGLPIADPKSRNLRTVNLNSLPLLREILRHGSVSKAAEAINISQPALSSTLKQLRVQFEDDLIVRSGNRVKLTPKAEKLLAPLDGVLQALEGLVFDDDADTRIRPSILIATNDHIMTTVGSRLARIVTEKGAGFMPQFVAAGANSLRELTAGNIDFIIAPRLGLMGGAPVSANKLAQMEVELLLSEPLVAIVSASAGLDVADISIEDYLGQPHVGFDVGIGRDLSNEQIYLSSLGFQQFELIRFSSYSALIEAVISSHAIGLIPESLARLYASRTDLQLFKPPIAFPLLEYNLVWLRSRDQDSYFEQLREALKLGVDELSDKPVFQFS